MVDTTVVVTIFKFMFRLTELDWWLLWRCVRHRCDECQSYHVDESTYSQVGPDTVQVSFNALLLSQMTPLKCPLFAGLDGVNFLDVVQVEFLEFIQHFASSHRVRTPRTKYSNDDHFKSLDMPAAAKIYLAYRLLAPVFF